ncbi:MAG: cadherin-like domain-containing protein [Kiritimatiellae bacterium]|nr:cadherin-like domain-containing protein [Kiritimatiellia bacterium]
MNSVHYEKRRRCGNRGRTPVRTRFPQLIARTRDPHSALTPLSSAFLRLLRLFAAILPVRRSAGSQPSLLPQITLCATLLAWASALTHAGAAWSTNSSENTPICTAAGEQQNLQVCTDGAGGMIMVWEDTRSGDTNIYAQCVNYDGDVQWTSNGVVICDAAAAQLSPQIVSDNVGGAIITWQDLRGGGWDIYAQRISYTGTVEWAANGIAVCSASDAQTEPQITGDNVGGAIVTWQENRDSNLDIYAQRLSHTGTVYWAANGVTICNDGAAQQTPKLTGDNVGGAIIAWQDSRGSDIDIYAQRISHTGTVYWAANGVAVCAAASNQTAHELIGDNVGGAILVWEDLRAGNSDLYAQRVSHTGAVYWAANGIVICSDAAAQTDPYLTPDGIGGTIVTWADSRGSDIDIYGQHLSTTGTVSWTADGVVVCDATGQQTAPAGISDSLGGALVSWQDCRTGTNDLYAELLDKDGAAQWAADGLLLCGAASAQTSLRVVSDGRGGTISAWSDSRNGTGDIYAQRLYSTGALQAPADVWAISPETNNVVSAEANAQQTVAVCPDGRGGAIMAWHDQRSDLGAVYAQRFDAYGNAQWTNGGLLVCNAGNSQEHVDLASDGQGGCVAVWQDGRSGYWDIYSQHIDANGALLWPGNGTVVCSISGNNQNYPRCVADGNGGVVITWHDKRSGNLDIYAQRLDSNGSSVWTSNGVAICTAANAQDYPRICSDGHAGAIISWHDDRGTSQDIYAQLVTRDGTVTWVADGTPVCDATGAQDTIEMDRAYHGGAILAWSDSRTDSGDIYAQKLAGDGGPSWTSNGIPVCDASFFQGSPVLATDGAGRAFITWEDLRNGQYDIYAQALDANGQAMWTSNGRAACTFAGEQRTPSSAPDGRGGSFFAWQDRRDGTEDVYVQRFDPAGSGLWTSDGVVTANSTNSQSEVQIVPDGQGGVILAWHDERSGARDVYAQRLNEYGNWPPVSMNDTGVTAVDTAVLLSVLDNDTDSNTDDTLTVVGIAQGAHGSVVTNAAATNITYRPSASYSGEDSFSYTASDGRGGTSTASVDIFVATGEAFWFRAVGLTNSAFLRWLDPRHCGMSNNAVTIRYSTDDYPTNLTDGTEVYTGTNTLYEDRTNAVAYQTNYYTIWVSHDGVTFEEPPTD